MGWYQRRVHGAFYYSCTTPFSMFSARSKIIKSGNERPDEFETSISQAILELESNSDLKANLRELYITAAKEVDVGGGKKSIVIFVPVPQLRQFHKIQVRLVRELEKKFSGKHIVFIAQRRILQKPTRKSKIPTKQKRPRSRTLTAVPDNILEELSRFILTNLNKITWSTRLIRTQPFTNVSPEKMSPSNFQGPPKCWCQVIK